MTTKYDWGSVCLFVTIHEDARRTIKFSKQHLVVHRRQTYLNVIRTIITQALIGFDARRYLWHVAVWSIGGVAIGKCDKSITQRHERASATATTPASSAARTSPNIASSSRAAAAAATASRRASTTLCRWWPNVVVRFNWRERLRQGNGRNEIRHGAIVRQETQKVQPNRRIKIESRKPVV
jgi:hypothetical protein